MKHDKRTIAAEHSRKTQQRTKKLTEAKEEALALKEPTGTRQEVAG